MHVQTKYNAYIQIEKLTRQTFTHVLQMNKNDNRFKLTSLYRLCRNPNLAKCGGEAQHLEKLGIWSPPGLPNV